MQDPRLTETLRNRMTVIRHRATGRLASLSLSLAQRLAGRGHQIVSAAAVLALAGLALLALTSPAGTPSSTTATAEAAVTDRQADTDRADRNARPTAETGATMVAPAAPSAPAAAAPTTAAPPPAWVNPIPGAAVTSCYGARWGTQHLGVDLGAPLGTPVRAVGAGTVEAAGWVYTGYGISVVINHGEGFLSHYAHLNGTAVGVGKRVAPDQVIGYEGSTGDSTGPHLHFEIHRGMWNQVEPAEWLRARGVNLPGC